LTFGSVTILGSAPGRRRRRIGYVPQRKSFDRTLRIRGVDVVRLGLEGTRWGLPAPGRAARRAREAVEEVVGLVGASAFAARPVGDLSGGEQQRLVIAQALVRRASGRGRRARAARPPQRSASAVRGPAA